MIALLWLLLAPGTAERVAREHLAPARELVAPSVRRFGDLTVVRFAQRARGLPVHGGGAAVLLDGAGRVRAGSVRLHAPTGPATPRVAAPDPRATLAWVPLAGEARLGWLVAPGPSLLALSSPLQAIDAQSGARLWTREGARRARARVYPSNPVATPALEDVALLDLGAGDRLSGLRVEALGCPDRHRTVAASVLGTPLQVHVCTEEALARADARGDFLYAPDLGGDPLDEFAETHVYHHATRAARFLADLGAPPPPLRAVVNVRLPFPPDGGAIDLGALGDPMGPLHPLEGAFFLPAGSVLVPGVAREASALVFGQGAVVDYAYDGEAVAHEVAHAAIAATGALAAADLDAQGFDPSTGALGEGYADYVAGVLARNPRIAEYAAGPGGALRDLTAPARCPAGLSGEPHHDSQPWSGALWDLTLELGDAAVAPVLAAMTMLAADADFEEASRLTAAAVEAALGEAAGRLARQIFEERGVWACERVVPYDGPIPLVHAPGPQDLGTSPYAPGAFQIRVDGRAVMGPLSVYLQVAEPPAYLAAGVPPAPLLLVKPGAPVQFTYQAGVVSADAAALVPFAPEGDQLVARWEGPVEASDHFLVIANAGRGATLRQVVLGTTQRPAPPDAAAAPDAAPDAAPGPAAGGPPPGGCAATPVARRR